MQLRAAQGFSMTIREPVLSRKLLAAFSLPMAVLGLMHGPEQLLHGIYAKHAGLPLTSLAVALVLTRLFDALTYPLVGYLSDRTAKRTGSRKSWLVAGTIAIVIALWFLYRPPEHVTIVYFTGWFMAGYLGWK